MKVADLAVVVVEDDRGTDCSIRLPLCLVDVEADGSDATNVTARADMRLRYVGVGVAGESFPVLPDDSLRVSGSEVFLPNPILPFLHERVGHKRAPAPLDDVQLSFGESELAIDYYGPSSKSQDPLLDNRRWFLTYNDSVMGYRRFGPYNSVGGNETDASLRGLPGFLCRFAPGLPCTGTDAWVIEAVIAVAPNARWGLDVDETHVVTNASRLEVADAQAGPPRALPPPIGIGNASLEPQERFLSRASDPAPLRPASSAPEHRGPVGKESGPGKSRILENSKIPVPSAPPQDLPLIIAAAAALAFMLLRGYTRFETPDDVLKSSPRVALLVRVRAQPGVRLSELVSALRLTRTAVVHHATTLQRAGLLHIHREKRNVLLFPPGQFDTSPAPGLAALHHPVCSRITALVAGRGGEVARADIHAMLPEVPERSRNYSIRRLIREGLLDEVERDNGRYVRIPR